MGHDDMNRTDRRKFLQAGALATAAAASVAPGVQAQEPANGAAGAAPLKTRKLGKTGVEVTILEQGAVRGQDRILRQAFANGVRLFDTAKVYGTEAAVQEVVRTVSRGSQADLPRDQGHAEGTERSAENGRPASGGPGHGLH